MSITLTRNAQTLDLPEALLWTDELAWSPVVQSVAYSIEGALIVDRLVRQAGRPITLAGSATRGWVERGTLRQLQAWACDAAEAVMVLILRNAAYRVIFDLAEGGAVQGEPVLAWDAPQDADAYFNVKLKFLEVAQ
jgi:hypothetical protein